MTVAALPTPPVDRILSPVTGDEERGVIDVWLTKRAGKGAKGKAKTVWLIRWRDGARVHEQSGGTDKTLARNAALQKWRELNGLDAGTVPASEWADFCDREAEITAGVLEPETRAKYARVLKAFGERTGVSTPTAVDVQVVQTYRASRLDAGKAQATVNTELRHLKAVWERAKAEGRVRDNPFAAVKPIKLPEPTLRIVTPAEEAKILAECKDLRLRAAVACALACGHRRGELLAQERADVDLSTGVVLIRCHDDYRTKAKRNRLVKMDAQALALAREVNALGPGRYLFRPDKVGVGYAQAFYRRFERACARAKIVNVAPHDLRRTCASRLAAGGMAPAALREYMGHRSIQTTQRYYIRIEAEEVLAQADRARMGQALRETVVSNTAKARKGRKKGAPQSAAPQ